MLYQLKDAPEINLFAHNMTYDGSFMLKYLMSLQLLEKDNKYVSLKRYCCSKNPGTILTSLRNS